MKSKDRPGLFAPAFVFFAAQLLTTSPALAQRQAPPPPQIQPSLQAPDSLTAAKLVWSTISAVDHANRTGNYSVLRDLGSQSFQSTQSAATLAQIFADLRNRRIDVGNALLVSPVYEIPPSITAEGLLRVRGVFPLRPESIRFDMLFQRVNGDWRLFGIAVIGVPAVLPGK